MQREFLTDQLMSTHSEAYWGLVVDRLLKLLSTDPHLLNLTVAEELISHLPYTETWLDAHFDSLVELCLAEPNKRQLRYLARQWQRLGSALKERIEGWDATTVDDAHTMRRKASDEYRTSSAFRYLTTQYDQAKNGDRGAYGQLARIANRWRGNIPMRAVAAHLIGDLRFEYDVIPVLSQLLRFGNVYWDDQRFDSPIRYEAGEALLSIPTPAVWETMVDSYFIEPRDDLLGFQIDWIEHLTDVLSGETIQYQGLGYGEMARRPWFQALSQVTDEELSSMTK